MIIIDPKVEEVKQKEGLLGVYKQIEMAGRTCYKSEDKITEDSAKGFVERMIASKHTAMLEHGTVYLTIPVSDINVTRYSSNPYSSVVCTRDKDGKWCYFITTNYRVIIENGWTDDLIYLSEPTGSHKKDARLR